MHFFCFFLHFESIDKMQLIFYYNCSTKNSLLMKKKKKTQQTLSWKFELLQTQLKISSPTDQDSLSQNVLLFFPIL